MSLFTAIVCITLVGLVIQQAVNIVVVWFAWRPRQTAISDEGLLPALVVLPLRGADPFLHDCLRNLFNQDYPQYQVRIVIDHPTDPCWSVVHDVIAEMGVANVAVAALESPAKTCSLKCSAVHQATADLPSSCEAVVTLDADVVPHKTWLRELIAPMKDPKVGAAMGNRWYAPPTAKLVPWIRYVWNVAAVCVMYFVKIPWGGSLAYRASILRDSDLRDRWLKAGCEDVPLQDVLHKKHLKLAFVPSAIMVNREEQDWHGCMRFIYRQLVWTRLYRALGWWVTTGLYFIITMLQLAAVGAAVAFAADGNWLEAGLLLGAVAFYLAAQFIQLVILEFNIRRSLAAKGERGARIGATTVMAILAIHLLTPAMFWRSLTMRTVDWRGIRYKIRGRWDIRMVEYTPYQSATQHEENEELQSAAASRKSSL